MKRFISLFFAVLIAFCCTVSSAAEEETLPIPERPENFYIIDESGLLDKRTIDALQKKGDALFAVTGAQVVFIVVAEDDKTDLGELAQQTLEVWELGSYERDNGIVVTMNFNRGRVSYAVGDGITDLYNTATMQELITSHHVGDYFAKASPKAKLLYINLSFYADCGFVANPKQICESMGYDESVLQELIDIEEILTIKGRSEMFLTSYFVHNANFKPTSWAGTPFAPYWEGKLWVKKNRVATLLKNSKEQTKPKDITQPGSAKPNDIISDLTETVQQAPEKPAVVYEPVDFSDDNAKF